MLCVRNRYFRTQDLRGEHFNGLFKPDPTKTSHYSNSAPKLDPTCMSLSGSRGCPRKMLNARNANPDLSAATKKRSTVSATRHEGFFRFLYVLSLQSQFPPCAQFCIGFFSFCFFLQNLVCAAGWPIEKKQKKRPPEHAVQMSRNFLLAAIFCPSRALVAKHVRTKRGGGKCDFDSQVGKAAFQKRLRCLEKFILN